jgi:hypothetical protein
MTLLTGFVGARFCKFFQGKERAAASFGAIATFLIISEEVPELCGLSVFMAILAGCGAIFLPYIYMVFDEKRSLEFSRNFMIVLKFCSFISIVAGIFITTHYITAAFFAPKNSLSCSNQQEMTVFESSRKSSRNSYLFSSVRRFDYRVKNKKMDLY